MFGSEKLEELYQKFYRNLGNYLQDGIVKVDLTLLKRFNLLNRTPEEEKELQSQFPFYFHVIESSEKVTLFNNQFVVRDQGIPHNPLEYAIPMDKQAPIEAREAGGVGDSFDSHVCG